MSQQNFENKLTDIGLAVAEAITGAGKAMDTFVEGQPELVKGAENLFEKLSTETMIVAEKLKEAVEKTKDTFYAEQEKDPVDPGDIPDSDLRDEISEVFDSVVEGVAEVGADLSEMFNGSQKSKKGKTAFKNELVTIKSKLTKGKKKKDKSSLSVSFKFNSELFSKRAVDKASVTVAFEPSCANQKTSSLIGVGLTIKLKNKNGDIVSFSPGLALTAKEFKLFKTTCLDKSNVSTLRKQRTITIRIESSDLPF